VAQVRSVRPGLFCLFLAIAFLGTVPIAARADLIAHPSVAGTDCAPDDLALLDTPQVSASKSLSLVNMPLATQWGTPLDRAWIVATPNARSDGGATNYQSYTNHLTFYEISVNARSQKLDCLFWTYNSPILNYSDQIQTSASGIHSERPSDLIRALNTFVSVSYPYVFASNTNINKISLAHRISADAGYGWDNAALKLTAGQDGLDLVQRRSTLLNGISGISGTSTIPNIGYSGLIGVTESCFACYDFRHEDTDYFQALQGDGKSVASALSTGQFGTNRFIFDPSSVNFPYDSGGSMVVTNDTRSASYGVRGFNGIVTPSSGSPYSESGVIGTVVQPIGAAHIGMSYTSASLGSGFDASGHAVSPILSVLRASQSNSVLLAPFQQTAVDADASIAGRLGSGDNAPALSGLFEFGQVSAAPPPPYILGSNNGSLTKSLGIVSFTQPLAGKSTTTTSTTRARALAPTRNEISTCSASGKDAIQLAAGWRDVGGGYAPIAGTSYTLYGLQAPTAGVAFSQDNYSVTAQGTSAFDGTGRRYSDTIATFSFKCQQGARVTAVPEIDYQNTRADSAIWARVQGAILPVPASLLQSQQRTALLTHAFATVTYLDWKDPTHPRWVITATPGVNIASTTVSCDAGSLNLCNPTNISGVNGSLVLASRKFFLRSSVASRDIAPGEIDSQRYVNFLYAGGWVIPALDRCATFNVAWAQVRNDLVLSNDADTIIASVDVPVRTFGSWSGNIIAQYYGKYLPTDTGITAASTKTNPLHYVSVRLRVGAGKRYDVSSGTGGTIRCSGSSL